MQKGTGFRLKQLKRTFKYTKKEADFIATLMPFQGDEWDGDLIRVSVAAKASRNDIKVKIKNSIQKYQGNNCIFCGWSFDIVGVSEREHVAPKGRYRDFVFEPYNLVLACHFCNGSSKKGQANTISKLNTKYNKCRFKIVHPYFDDVSKHIVKDYDKINQVIMLKAAKWSRKGKATIDMFELNGSIQAQLRAGYAMQKHLKLNADQHKQMRVMSASPRF